MWGVTDKLRHGFSLAWQRLAPWNYKTTVVAYLFIFACIIIPKLAIGEAIIPTSLARNAGLVKPTAGFFENPQWSDYMNVFMPTMYAHLHAPASGWAPTWNPLVEMGRPLRPEWGFTTAYPFTWLLTRFTENPFILATVFSFHICLLAGLWLIGIGKERGYDPLAAFVVATLTATAPLFFQLLTHYTYIAMPAGFFGIIYLLLRWRRTMDVWGALGIVWQCYSFVVMSYYQEQVYGYYILFGFVLLLVWSLRADPRKIWLFLGSLTGLVLLAGALLVPYMLDFVQNVRLSLRTENPLSFFIGSIAAIDSPQTFALYLLRLVAPELVGSPRIAELPQPSVGFGLPMLFFPWVLLACIRRLRTEGYWVVVLTALWVINLSPAVFTFMFEHMFLNLSRTKPLFIMSIPLVLLAFAGADEFFRALRNPGRRGWMVRSPIGGLVVCNVVVLLAACVEVFAHTPDWSVLLTNFIVLVLCCIAVVSRRRWLWALVVCVSVAGVSYPYILWNRRDLVVTTTPFIEAVRAELKSGGRFARTTEFGPVLTPNSSVLFGIPTIHALNAILPARYTTFVQSLGGTIINHNILAKEIDPDYGALQFWMTDTRVVGTIRDLKAVPELAFVKKVAGLSLYRVRDSMGCCIQVPLGSVAGSEATLADPRPRGFTRLRKSLDLGDIYEVPVTATASPYMVVISQQYHPQWRVYGMVDGVWQISQPLAVNGFFQGAVIPAGATTMRFEFRPWVRFAWTAHVFFFGALLGAVAWTWRESLLHCATVLRGRLQRPV